MSSENQTLILAGELVPRRGVSALVRRPLTIVAMPVEDPMLIGQMAERGSAATAANAYARTQQLSAGRSRAAIIDTYA